jgi:predicted transposase/invertase (TIGR01784 family)
MEKRLKFYSDRLSSTTLEKGEKYYEAQKVVSIAILNHKFYKNKKDTYNYKFELWNTKDKFIYDDNPLEIIIFDKMKKRYYNINNPIDRIFMYFFGLFNSHEFKQLMNDELIREIEEEKNMISKSQEAEILKIELEKRRMDEEIRMETAIEESKKKAKIEGMKEGKLEGMKEGEMKGKLEIAINLLRKGMDLGSVSEVTGLPISKLESLKY